MSTPTAQIKVTLESAQAESDAKSFSETLLGALTPTIDVADLLASAWDTIKSAISNSVGAAIEAQDAEARLTAALRERGIATGEVVDRLNTYNSALADATGIGDEALLGIQSQLVALGAHQNSLTIATRATLGLAEVSGKDLPAATQLMGRVLDGNVKILERYGIHARDSADALEQLASKAELTSDAGQTTQGRIERLANAVGELSESIGKLITAQEDGVGWIDRTTDSARRMAVGTDVLVGKIIGLRDGITGLGVDLAPVGVALDSVFAGIPSTIKRAMDSLEELGDRAETERAVLARLTELMAPPPMQIATKEAIREYIEAGKKMVLGADEAIESERKTEIARRKRAAEDHKRDAANEADMDGAMFRMGIAGVHQIAEDERAILAAKKEADRMDLDRQIAHKDALFQVDVAAYEERKALQDREEASKNRFFGSLIQSGIGLAASLGASIGSAAATQEEAGVVMQRFGGQVISMIGNTLVQLGTAAIVAGAIGTAAPWLFGITGGPAAVAAGAAAVVVGTGLVALGSYVSGSAGSKAGKAAGKGGGGGSSARTQADDTSGFTRGKESVSSVFNINFMGGIFGGDPRKVGRELRDLIEGSNSLSPVRR